MRVKLNTGICPVINVGMYETILDPRVIFERDEHIVDYSNKLTDEDKDYFYEALLTCFNTHNYHKIIAKYATTELADFFESIKSTIKINICGEGKINSPREYNFRSDELDFEVEINSEEINSIFSRLCDEFWTWAEKYRSCSGFASFMPWRKGDYFKAIHGTDIERALAMYLTFLFEQNRGFKDEAEYGSSYNIYEQIVYNHSLSEFIDDQRAQNILYNAGDMEV